MYFSYFGCLNRQWWCAGWHLQEDCFKYEYRCLLLLFRINYHEVSKPSSTCLIWCFWFLGVPMCLMVWNRASLDRCQSLPCIRESQCRGWICPQVHSCRLEMQHDRTSYTMIKQLPWKATKFTYKSPGCKARCINNTSASPCVSLTQGWFRNSMGDAANFPVCCCLAVDEFTSR